MIQSGTFHQIQRNFQAHFLLLSLLIFFLMQAIHGIILYIYLLYPSYFIHLLQLQILKGVNLEHRISK